MGECAGVALPPETWCWHYSFGLRRHMETQGFQLCTSFWKSRSAWVAPAVLSSSTGNFNISAMYFSICSRTRGSFSAANLSGFSMWVNAPHSGHLTTSSSIMVTLSFGEISDKRWRSTLLSLLTYLLSLLTYL